MDIDLEIHGLHAVDIFGSDVLNLHANEFMNGRFQAFGADLMDVLRRNTLNFERNQVIRRKVIEAFRFHSVDVRLRRSEEHTSELQSPYDLVCRLLLEK